MIGVAIKHYLPLSLLALVFALIVSGQAAAKTTGADIYSEVLQGTRVYDDPILDSYVRKLGEEVVAQ